jgi:methyl-accepting chemotaxis protein
VQIDTAMQQLDQTTQRNAALVEEAAAAASSLHDRADRLTRSVAAFKTSVA